MNNNTEKVVVALGIIAAILILAGLIKAFLPLIVLGLVIYAVYCFIRGPKP